MSATYFDLAYLVCSILIIIGLRKLSHPSTSRIGNRYVTISLIAGIFISVFYPLEQDYGNLLFVFASLILGAIIGITLAKKVALTSMPEMVSALNGLGGGSAFLVSLVWLIKGFSTSNAVFILILINLFVGGLTLIGSFIAYGKLSGALRKPLNLPLNRLTVNGVFLVSIIAIIVYIVSTIGVNNSLEEHLILVSVFIAISLFYGFILVMPIGGADMPVVISLLNSLTGITTAISGLMANDKFMFLGGVLVGSSGIILTLLMCKAMNRSFYKVIFTGFGKLAGSSGGDSDKTVRESNASELGILLAYAQKVAVVPGYGLAVAQAQKLCKELESILNDKGVDVKYTVHPVAGRMPGHMNVLLAEADVSYDSLLDLEEANAFLQDADVALVLGANDVINSSATEDQSSPIYGMPIIDLASTKQNIIVKRSMNPGYAGIDNPTFYKANSKMFFGDISDVLQKTIEEVKNA